MSEYNHNQVKPDPREAPETTDFSRVEGTPRDRRWAHGRRDQNRVPRLFAEAVALAGKKASS